jgi:hypothetical protein
MDYEALGIWLAFWALSSYLLSLKSRSKIITIGTGFLISTIGFAMLVATVNIIAEQREKEIANKAGFATHEKYTKAAAADFQKADYDKSLSKNTDNNDKPAEISPSDINHIILEARVLTFDELSSAGVDDETIARLSGMHPSYSLSGGWTKHHLTPFPVKDSWFVWAKIAADALAKITYVNQCGYWMQPERCSKKELREKLAEFRQETERAKEYGPRILYGKYKNVWAFEASGSPVPETERYRGHWLAWVKRNSLLSIDEVVIGPLPEKPDKMIIRIWNESAAGFPDLVNPSVSLDSSP